MKKLIKTATVFCIAAIGILSLMSCEGADLYKVVAPDWLADMELEEQEVTLVEVTPNPTTLGATDNSTAWWTVFTDDIKADSGMTYQVKFVNYGGNSNWKNFLIVLRNAAKDVEYAVLRSDNWGWTSADTDGANSDNYFMKKMESDSRDWGTWLKAMSMAKCTATIANYGNGKSDVKITMLGADNVTYTQEYTDIAVDKDDLYFCFTCEGSHLEFGDFDIEDSEPTAIALNGVPRKVLLGTSFEDAFANVSATVTFGEGVNKDVEISDLQMMALPDMSTLGTKSLVAVYNKTFLGNNCTTPVIAQVDFEVVDNLSSYTCLGDVNNTTAFWGAHSDMMKVAANETFVYSFTNYTDGLQNYHNFYVVLSKGDLTLGAAGEYGVLRADNFGWGTGYDACTHSGTQGDWAAWLKVMDESSVTVSVTNKGDGTADVRAIMVGNDGNTYTQDYIGVNTVDPDDFYCRLTVENCHLEFDDVVGAENNSTAFWGDHSDMIQIPAGKTYTRHFKNYTDGLQNYHNFYVVLSKGDLTLGAAGEYGVLRADNFGWGTGYDACTHSGTQGDWAAWLKVMDESSVTVSVTNKGDGTADVRAIMVGNDGNTYTQDYIGVNTVDPDDFYFRFTVENSHLIFE